MLIQRHKSLMSSLVLGLYASTLAFASGAAPRAQVNDSQERALLTNLVALQAQGSANQYRAEVSNLISKYDQSASWQGRSDRLLQAMTEMGMTTADEAQRTKALIESDVANEYAAHPDMSKADLAHYSAEVTMNEVNRNFLGAQFSGCMVQGIAASAVLAGAILGDVYANSLTQTSTTSTSTLSADGTYSNTSNNGSSTIVTSTTVKGGTATTTITTTNTREQSMLRAVSGIMYGVSGALFAWLLFTDSDLAGTQCPI